MAAYAAGLTATALLLVGCATATGSGRSPAPGRVIETTDGARTAAWFQVCLTSNDVILGIRGEEHPFRTYMEAGIPLVLATDDAGVSRIDLSHEYLRAVRAYGLGYRQLKTLTRNSLHHSFLAGDSLRRADFEDAKAQREPLRSWRREPRLGP